MRKNALKWMCLFSVALAFALSLPSRAAADDDDPPSRVARLAFTRGAVSFQPAGTDDWVDATVNRPMTTGDKIWADQDSRAALHIGSASINLSQNTGFSFLNLTDNVTQLQITAGTIRVRVKRLGDDENFEIDTPNLAFSVLRPGIYKINVNDAGDTTVTEVRKGEGEVTGGGSAYTVHAGEIGTFAGTDELNADVEGINSDEDDFDHWSEQRDHHEDVSISARYVSDDAIGYDDLDDNGGWRPVGEYGNVWFPRTAIVGWAPYHYGHWAYVEPWGYTWVDDAAWGFAPFHYGRWVSVEGAWGWVPCAPRAEYVGGAVYVRPVYAPALVAWVGGPGFGIGVAVGGGGGGVGWFPLGPREVYVPAYHVSRAYVENVNVSNTRVSTTVVNNYYTNVVVNKNVNVTNVTYVNQRVPGAVAATSPQAFTSGQSVAKNSVHVDARAVASAPVVAVTPPAVPQREAVVGGRASATVRPPAAVQARAVVAKTPPPPPPPAFAQRQAAIQSNGGRPLSVAQVRQITPPARAAQGAAPPQVKIAPPAKPATPANAGNRGVQPNNANRPGGNPPAQANRPGEAQNNANRPATNNQPVNNQPANNNRPGEVQNNNNVNRPPANNQPANNANRPAEVENNTNRPAANSQPANNNRPGEVQNNANRPAANTQPTNAARPNDRPPTAAAANPQLQQQHQQQNADLQKQQQEERQRLQQQQQQQQQELQKQKADEAKQQQIQQQHQQQQQELQQKHAQQQQQLQQKQEQERQRAQPPAPKPQQQSKPEPKQEQKPKPKDEKPPR